MSPTCSRRTVLGRAAAWLALAVALLLGSPAPAMGHAYLEHTNPADGSVLGRAPDRLALSFSEHVVLEATVIDVVDGSGHVVRLDDLSLETEERDDLEAPSVVTAALPDLSRGAYHVRWSTLSSDDLHRTSGFFVFGVGTAVAPSDFSEPSPRGVESGLRWLLLIGVAVGLGATLVGRLTTGSPVRMARRLGRAGAASALLVSFALLLDQALVGGLSLQQLVGSGYAARWGLRELGLLLLLISFSARLPSRSRTAALAIGSAATALGTAVLGHAGAEPGPAYTRVLATAVHLLAMLTWTGGVICLAAILLAGRVHRGTADLDVRMLLRRFGLPAAACLGLGVATGVYLSSSTVVSVDAALATTYGRTLVLKVALGCLLVLLAVHNHRRLDGAHDIDLPRRGVLAEAVTAAVVLGATAVLTSAQPATEPRFLDPPAATAGPVSTRADDLHLDLDVAPNTPGPNVVSVDVFDTRRPAPGQVTSVAVSIDGVVTQAAPLGDGRWSVAGADLSAGAQRLEVTVTRPGLPQAHLRTGWTVGAGDRGADPIVSTTPLRPYLRVLALLVLGTWLVALGLTFRARRRASTFGRPHDRPRPAIEAPVRDGSPVP